MLLAQSLSPVSRATMSMCYRQYEYILIENDVHNAERKLMENVPAEAGEVGWPPFGRFSDSRNRALKFIFKI
jgi:hypothetical protein